MSFIVWLLLSEWDDFFNVANVDVVLCCRHLKVLPLFECDSVGFVLVVFWHCEVERADQGMRAQVDALFVDFVLVWLLLYDRCCRLVRNVRLVGFALWLALSSAHVFRLLPICVARLDGGVAGFALIC